MKFSNPGHSLNPLLCISIEKYLDIILCIQEVLRIFLPDLGNNDDFFLDVFP